MAQCFRFASGGRPCVDAGSPSSGKHIDIHIHYDGEPGILEKLLDKFDANDGLAFLLTTPAGFPQASKFIHEHPGRFIGFGDIKLDDPNVLQEIDRFHAAGFRSLRERSPQR